MGSFHYDTQILEVRYMYLVRGLRRRPAFVRASSLQSSEVPRLIAPGLLFYPAIAPTSASSASIGDASKRAMRRQRMVRLNASKVPKPASMIPRRRCRSVSNAHLDCATSKRLKPWTTASRVCWPQGKIVTRSRLAPILRNASANERHTSQTD